MIRAMNMRRGKSTHVYIVESKNSGIAISFMLPKTNPCYSCTMSGGEWEHPEKRRRYTASGMDTEDYELSTPSCKGSPWATFPFNY
jgi:hypothetical protein